MTYTSKYPIINVTVDIVVNLFDVNTGNHQIVLIRRGNDPFKGKLALPGGFIDPDEDAVQAALRELREETGISLAPDDLYLYDVRSAVNRDPRGRTISIVYQYDHLLFDGNFDWSSVKAGDDANEIIVVDGKHCPFNSTEFAFDHWDILFGKH